jgi:excisionase family DNA binding protein
MPKDSGVPALGGEAALRLLAEALAPHLRQHFRPTEGHAGFYSQYDSPLGRTRHLELVRRGTLPGNKVGRRVLVRRDRVDAYIEAHAASPRSECHQRPSSDPDPPDPPVTSDPGGGAAAEYAVADVERWAQVVLCTCGADRDSHSPVEG